MTAELTLSSTSVDPIAEQPASVRSRDGLGRRGVTAFVVAFLLSFIAIGTWSIATPLFAAPDEPVHIIKAAAVARGELLGTLQGPSTSPFGSVTVPAFYAGTRNIPSCFHRHAAIPANCAPSTNNSSTATSVYIYNARYPPLYYAIVGLPSLLGTSNIDIYLMRLMSAALSALFIALAVFSVARWSRSRLPIIGIVVATTPMVLFLGGVVNPAGLEASAGIAVWTAGAVLVVDHLDDPPRGLLAVLVGSSVVLELVRPLSPFWLGLIAIVLLAVSNATSLRKLIRHRNVKIGVTVVFVAGLVAVAWIVSERSYDVYSTASVGYSVPESTILETSFLHNDYYLPGMIGVFGWFDTYAPTLTYVVWYGLIGLVTILAAALGRVRDALTLVAFALAIVLIPVAISSSQVHRDGFTWAGKDTLVFAVGLPILAATLVGRSPLALHRSRLTAIVGGLALVAQVAAFFEMLRRYAVGTKGPDFGFLLHAHWHAPVGFAALLVVEILALAALGVAACRLVRPDSAVPFGSVPRHRTRRQHATQSARADGVEDPVHSSEPTVSVANEVGDSIETTPI